MFAANAGKNLISRPERGLRRGSPDYHHRQREVFGMLWFLAVLLLITLAAAPILLVVTLVQLANLRRRVEHLESGRPPPRAPAPAPPPRPETAPPPSPPFSKTPPSPPPPKPVPAAAPAPPKTPPPSPARGPSLLRRAAGAVKRWFTTGNVPVKVGVILSLLGLSFLIQTALNRGWITLNLETRLAIAGLFGLAMLIIGFWVRGRNLVYALSLQGGGVAVMYLTVYSSLVFYEVLAAPPAFVAVAVITAAAGVMSAVQNSRSLAVLGIIGGFLAPILISADDGSHLVLFGYLAALNLAVLFVAWFKTWPELNLLGWLFTFGISAHWIFFRYSVDHLASAWPFPALFAAAYMTAPLLPARRPANGPLRRWISDGPLTFGSPFVFFALQNQMAGHTAYGLAWSALGLAAFHFLLWRAARPLRRDGGGPLGESHLGLGAVFLALAVPLAFDAFYTAAAWAAQGAALVWLNLRRRRLWLVAGGGVLQILAGISQAWFLAGQLPYPDGTFPVANRFLLGALLPAAAGLFSAWLLDRERHQSEATAKAAWIGMFWGAGWLLWGAVTEAVNQLGSAELYGSLAVVSAILGAGFLFAPAVRWPKLNVLGTLLLPVLAIFLFLALAVRSGGEFDLSHPLDDYGWAAWPLAFGMLYLFLRLRENLFPKLQAVLHGGGFWGLALLVGAEVHWLAGQAADGAWPAAASLAAVLAVAAIPLLGGGENGWPLGAHRRIYLTCGSGAILAGLALAAAFLNVFSNGDPAPWPYLPLLNPLEAVTVLLAAIAFRWRKRIGPYQGPALSAVRRSWRGWSAALGMILLTMTAARAVHHWRDVPFAFGDLFGSTVLQASLSILWGLAGLGGMIVGKWKAQRAAWVAGASLMGVVVVKLFLIDLGNTGALTRVVSFLGVGVLLLVVGYFAPVPPAAPRSPDDSPPP